MDDTDAKIAAKAVVINLMEELIPYVDDDLLDAKAEQWEQQTFEIIQGGETLWGEIIGEHDDR
jgi:hypothetical protein